MANRVSPTVLVIDDESYWRDTFEIMLSEAGYSVLVVGAEPNIEQAAFETLSSHRVDAVVSDVILYGIPNTSNTSGLKLAEAIRLSFPEMCIVIKTAYQPGPQLEEWKDRHSRLADKVADAYITGMPYNDLVEILRQLFRDKVRTHFSLEFDEEDLSVREVAETFADRLPLTAKLNPHEEVELLLRRLYFEKEDPPDKIRLQPLVPGKSKAPVLLVTPYYGSEREPEVVKLDERPRSERELSNYRQYVRGQLGERRAPHEERTSHTENLGAFAITNLGIAPGKLEEFGTFYGRNKDSNRKAILAAVTDLFERTCTSWYKHTTVRKRPTSHWLDEEFPEWGVRFLEGISNSTRGKGDALAISFVQAPEFQFHNPILLLQDSDFMKKLDENYLEAVTHGDLNARNLLVDQFGQTWLIDFYQTRPGHILRDLTRLETTVLFELLETENLRALIELSISLAQTNRLHTPSRVKGKASIPEIDVANRLISHIRGLASRALGLGRTGFDYYVISAFHSLRYASHEDVPLIRRQHAVAHAALQLSRADKETDVSFRRS